MLACWIGIYAPVHDLPGLQLIVTEHQAEVKCCPGCGGLNRAAFPADVNSVVQYGSGIKGLMVYLMEGQLLPSERVCELLKDVLGCELSEGTLYNARQRCDRAIRACGSVSQGWHPRGSGGTF